MKSNRAYVDHPLVARPLVGRRPRSFTTPIFYVIFLILVLAVIALLDREGEISELWGVALSTVVATAFWVGFQIVKPIKIGATRLSLLFNVIFFAKIAAGLCHFYLLFAPAAEITVASDIAAAKFDGDLAAIHNAAQYFMSVRSEQGLWYALTGDYYREINNSGVGIVYGLLYGAFGAYPTVGIPWSALGIALTALILISVGEMLGMEDQAIKVGAVCMLLMPCVLVTPPIYRDPFIIMLIVLLTFSFLYAVIKGSIVSLGAVLLATIALSSLRGIYIVLPVVLALVVPLGLRTRLTVRTRLWCMGLGAGLALSFWYLGAEVISVARETVSSTTASYDSLNRVTSSGVAAPLAKSVFLLLTPMPWWQAIDASRLVYQVFYYPNTLFTLMTCFALVLGHREGVPLPEGTLPLVLTGLALFIMAVFGSSLGPSYVQVMCPLLLLPASPVLKRSWGKCLSAAAAVVVMAHIFLLL